MTDNKTDYVEHNGVKWSTRNLDGGAFHTQTEWNELLKESEWRLPTVKEYESLLGCTNKAFMSGMIKDFEAFWLLTSEVLIDPFSGEKRPLVLGLGDISNKFVVSAYDGYGDWPARGVKK